MQFEKNQVYHIYNQGNNRRNVFANDKHYVYFLRKMRTYLLPHGDLLCYCLMPNHFHWLFFVKQLDCPVEQFNPKKTGANKSQNLNDSIGILLRTFTRGVNQDMGWSGSIFRDKTKAKSKCIDEFITVNSKHWDAIDYTLYCFDYIHQNPVKAKLTTSAEDWEFSSAKEYAGLRNGTLCNVEMGKEILNFV